MSETNAVVEKSLRSVFVGNIPYEATEEKLKEIFRQVGPVISFKLMYDRESGKPKGYGFCEYKDQETSLSAMRNLNGYEIGGRPLRVDNACTEKSRMEMQSLMMGPIVESPYGPVVEPGKAPEAISNAVASLPPEQMYELMRQMKLCVRNNPSEARTMLMNNPQLAYALLQAQVVMRIIDPKIAVQILHSPRDGAELGPLMPKADPPTSVPPPGAPAPINGNMTQPQMGITPRFPPPQMLGPPPTGPPPVPGFTPQQPPMPVPPPARPQNHAPPFPGKEFDRPAPMGVPPRGPPPNVGKPPDQDMRMPPMSGSAPPDNFSGPPPSNNFDSHRFEGNESSRFREGAAPQGGREQRDFPRDGPPRDGPPRDGPPRDNSRERENRPNRETRSGEDRDYRETRDSRRPFPGDSDFRAAGPTSTASNPPPTTQTPARTIPSIPNLPPGLAGQDQEKASLIMQVLQLSDEQIRMLPPEQQASILQLKEQIQRSQSQR